MTASLRDGVTVAGVSGAYVGAKFTTLMAWRMLAAALSLSKGGR